MLSFFKRTQPTSPTPRPKIFWGGIELDESESTGHFLCTGSPGSGKTIMMRVLMQSVLTHVGSGQDMRALVYDAKQDVLPILHAFCRPACVKTLNPFDDRGVAWDIHRDIREPRVAVEIAFTLIPPTQESQPFFSDAARHLLCGVMLSFMLSGVEWTFADLLRALRNRRHLKAILKRHPQTDEIVSCYFYDRRLLSNIMSTLATKLMPFEPIAAAWDIAKERVALEDWVRNEWILVLGNSETSRTAINAVNRCLFKRASDLALAQGESFTRRSWFIVDEASEAGRLDGLVSLLKKGRSKGACVAISFQSVSGLREASMYGQYFTDEILGQIANRFFGRVECPETAEWESRMIGDQEVDQLTTSQTSGENSSSTTTSTQPTTRRAVLPSQLMCVPPCNRANGLAGYFLLRSAGCFYAHFGGEEVFDEWLIAPDEHTPDFVPRDVRAQFLRRWTADEEARFAPPPPKRKLAAAPIAPDKRSSLSERLKKLDDLFPGAT
ncbi:MAG: type IV secretion system DNA-binding domain-containing protein [Planctomycetota bacterium]|nr:type IV secretion system DNA-binding domain-containing protein [Planctomycetota bacterium]